MRHFKKELNQPQERPSSSAILNQILNNKLRFCKKAVDISPGLKNLINGLLQKDINKRMSIKEVLSHPIMSKYESLIEMKSKYSDLEKFIQVLKHETF